MDRPTIYDIIYALAATDGREAALFGNCAPLAHWAFEHSLVEDTFPELWFELPLHGTPWFDLHKVISVNDLGCVDALSPEMTGGCPKVFEWFAEQENDVCQFARSWDIHSGEVKTPAFAVLMKKNDPRVTEEFLEAAGRGDVVQARRSFVERLPQGWFPCYTAVFPQRPGFDLRVECIPNKELQHAYANDSSLLSAHLKQVGLADLGDTLVQRCQLLARTPFQLEFQFDVDANGTTRPTFGASLRFNQPPGNDSWQAFTLEGAAGDLMAQVEAWGLADERWRLLADITFSKRASRGLEECKFFCFPAFVKLRWRSGEPLDAKAYLLSKCTNSVSL